MKYDVIVTRLRSNMDFVHESINDSKGISLKELEVLQEITAMTNNMLMDAIDERMKNNTKCCENMTDEHGEPSLYCCHEQDRDSSKRGKEGTAFPDNQDYLNYQLINEEK